MLWMLIAVPLLTGGGLLLGGRAADRYAAPVALAAAVAVLALAVAGAVGRPAATVSFVEGVAFGLAVDGLSAVMVVLVGVVLAAVTVFAVGEPGLARARFFGLLLVFAGAMLVTVTATTLLALLMAWEVMGAASYALIGFWWREPRRAESGTVAFLTTRAADLGLYLAAGAALAGGAGGLSLGALAGLPDGWRDAVAAGVVLAALGKSAQLPFSFWLSRAMDGPSPVSALLHSATMVAAGGYLLLRTEPLLTATPWAAAVVAVTGALTAVLLGAVAVVQHDLKQLLAASTCAQLGFVVLAAGTGGVAGGGGQLVAHALTKSLLFLCAGAWLTAAGTKELAGLRGAARAYPVVGITFTAGGVVLAGAPPLAIWVAKDHVLAGALRDSAWLYVLGLAGAALSAAYAARAVAVVWSRPDSERAGGAGGIGGPGGLGGASEASGASKVGGADETGGAGGVGETSEADEAGRIGEASGIGEGGESDKTGTMVGAAGVADRTSEISAAAKTGGTDEAARVGAAGEVDTTSGGGETGGGGEDAEAGTTGEVGGAGAVGGGGVGETGGVAGVGEGGKAGTVVGGTDEAAKVSGGGGGGAAGAASGGGVVGGWELSALPPLAAGAVLLGVLAVPGVWRWFAEVVAAGGEVAPSWWEVLVSGAVALGVGLAVAVVTGRRDRLGQPEPGRHELDRADDWLGLERFVAAVVTRPVLAGAGALARFDDRVIDRGVRAGAVVGTAFAGVADRRVEWSVDGLVRALARGFAWLGRLARRPQTGQLHQYYAQAVVALAALAALLLVLSNGR